MAVSSGNNVTAADYNGLQSRIANVLGTGSGTSGYGQSVSSSQVSVGDTITAAQMDLVRADMNKARAHQTGSNTSLGNIEVGDIIGADASGTDPASLTETSKGFNDYLTEMTNIETDKLTVDGTQVSVEAATSSTRTTSWNGTITHEFTVTFTSENHRRHFFNSGGLIYFDASLTGGSGSKDDDWRTILTNMGTISFGYTSTTSSGTGTGSSIGNYDLTTNWQDIFIKSGSAAVYAENEYQIFAKLDSTSVIRFQVRFEDNDVGDQRPQNDPVAGGEDGAAPAGPGVDENVIVVTGSVTSTIRQRRATGSNVAVASPSYANTSNL
jgi:hypothetical protein